MSSNPLAAGRVRPAAVVNEAIRAIAWRARGRDWTRAEQALYGLLLDEWAAALRAEDVATAA